MYFGMSDSGARMLEASKEIADVICKVEMVVVVNDDIAGDEIVLDTRSTHIGDKVRD